MRVEKVFFGVFLGALLAHGAGEWWQIPWFWPVVGGAVAGCLGLYVFFYARASEPLSQRQHTGFLTLTAWFYVFGSLTTANGPWAAVDLGVWSLVFLLFLAAAIALIWAPTQKKELDNPG